MTTTTEIAGRIRHGIEERDRVIIQVVTGVPGIDELAHASETAPTERASLDIHAALATAAYATGDKKLCMRALVRNWHILSDGQIHPLTQIIADAYATGFPQGGVREAITGAAQ